MYSIFKTELAYYYKQLSPNVRRMVRSNIFQIISLPLTSIFINAFIWQTTTSFLSVALFSVGDLFLPIAFFMNGLLLKKFHIKKLFLFGTICMSIAIFLLVVVGVKNNWYLLLFSCLFGFGSGLYWSNRNYLSLKETIGLDRKYFYSLTVSLETMVGILIPPIAGWFIVFGEHIGRLSSYGVYLILFTISFLLMLKAGFVIYQGGFDTPIPSRLLRPRVRPFLNSRRLLFMSNGGIHSIGFMSTLLILYAFKTEDILGTISAIIAACMAIAIYLYGRITNVRYQFKILTFSSLLFFLCTLLLVFLPSPVNVVAYVLLIAFPATFFPLVAGPINLSLTDKELVNEEERYSFIVDNEIFLNLGRLIPLSILIGLFFWQSQSFVLQYGPLIVALIQMSLLALFFRQKNKLL